MTTTLNGKLTLTDRHTLALVAFTLTGDVELDGDVNDDGKAVACGWLVTPWTACAPDGTVYGLIEGADREAFSDRFATAEDSGYEGLYEAIDASLVASYGADESARGHAAEQAQNDAYAKTDEYRAACAEYA